MKGLSRKKIKERKKKMLEVFFRRDEDDGDGEHHHHQGKTELVFLRSFQSPRVGSSVQIHLENAFPFGEPICLQQEKQHLASLLFSLLTCVMNDDILPIQRTRTKTCVGTSCISVSRRPFVPRLFGSFTTKNKFRPCLHGFYVRDGASDKFIFISGK